MSLPVTLILDLANILGLLTLVAICYGAVRRADLSPRLQSGILGILFTLAAIVAMARASMPIPGFMIDARVVVVALAAAFGGPSVAVLTAVGAGLYRISLGGGGWVLGLAVIVFGVAAGLVWRHHVRRRGSADMRSLFLLGLATSCQALLLPLLPIAATAAAIGLSVLMLMVSGIAATLVVGTLMLREDRLIAREKSLLIDACTDPLTGLANRRAFDRRLDEWTADAQHPPFALMMIDVDHFKAINDRFGHEVGDCALAAIGAVLRSLANEKTMVARYGGEEFAVLLWNCDLPAAMRRAENLRRLIAATPFEAGDEATRLTVSVGVSHTKSCATPGSVTRDADAALYRAKAAGRNRVMAARKPRAAATDAATPLLLASVGPAPASPAFSSGIYTASGPVAPGEAARLSL